MFFRFPSSIIERYLCSISVFLRIKKKHVSVNSVVCDISCCIIFEIQEFGNSAYVKWLLEYFNAQGQSSRYGESSKLPPPRILRPISSIGVTK